MSAAFYIVAKESGFGPLPLPTWTDQPGALDLFEARDSCAVERIDLPEVPGAFQLLNVLSDSEADAFVQVAERLGFHADAPVSLSYDVRHNDNMNWVVSEDIDGEIWARSKNFVPETFGNQAAQGLNARFRFYRYGEGDYFKPHTDGGWPGSRVIDGELVVDAYRGFYSQFTYLIFLNDGYEGGRTQFLVSRENPGRPAISNDDVNVVSITTPKGGVLCFPHGMHPQHCLHAGELIGSGTKYIIRSEILFG
ncbi:MAG: oxidoreductase [Pseudomonadota bacterium]